MRNYILVFFGCLLFHLAGTWSLPLIDRDEPRFAEAAREMRERADFIVPYFNNQFRFDKPPLTYWFQVASYRVFGENDFAARFPTAIAAALVAVILLAWGQQLGDEKVGWWAAIIFSLSLQTFIHGKAAVADMWLVLFVTVAHWAAWELFKANTEHRTPNGLLVDFLFIVRTGIFGQGADWMDAALNGCNRAPISSSETLCRTFQIRPRTLADVGVDLPLGNSGSCSHAGRVFPGRDWKACG